MGTKIIQPSFAGGELSPDCYGRVDLARYGTSVRTGKNFIVRPYGGLSNRPGFQFLGEVKDSATRVRLIPFEYSTEVAYVIELGDGYMRFWANGALVLDDGDPVEVVTPWAEADLSAVRFTQSADAMWFTHPSYPPQRLLRTAATTFVLAAYDTREGPFGSINADEAVTVTVTAKTGNVTVTANADIFTADMVGSAIYIEAKTLGQVRPWTQGDRGVSVGDLCRSDGKTYKAVTVPSGADWTETGSFRPVHDFGRAWDGRGDDDERTNGSQTWKVGIEWEYQDSGYGIVLITGFTDAKTVTGVVQRQLPDSVVGGLGSPGGTWTFSGNGSTKVFSITGATSNSVLDYTVTINGIPIQPNPFYTPPPGSGGGAGTSGQQER